MSTTVIALHGFTQNGSVMRAMLAPLAERLPDVAFAYPDAPNPCNEGSVARMHQLFGGTPEPPHRCWFDATDDGREYRGFDHVHPNRDGHRVIAETACPQLPPSWGCHCP